MHLRFRIDKSLAFHSNGMRFTAFDGDGAAIAQKVYFSVGGGFVVDEDEANVTDAAPKLRVPYPFTSAAELLAHGEEAHKRIPEMMRINELALAAPTRFATGLIESGTYHHEPRIERGMN